MRKRRPFHEAWLWITALALVVGVVIDNISLLTVAGLLAVILGLAWLWNRYSLAGVQYQRWIRYRRGFPGEETDASLKIENGKILPLAWLRTTDRWPTAIGPTDESKLSASHRDDMGYFTMTLAMRGLARTVRSFRLRFRKRGIYRIGPVEMISGDPFGLFVSTDEDAAPEDRMVVFPEIRPLTELGIKPDDPYGESVSRRQLFTDVSRPMGVREYQKEDGFRFIHWPATARTGELKSRMFQPVRGLDMVVCLNASTLEHYWQGTEPEMLEALIQTAASIIMEGMDQGYRVGLLSNGSIAHSGRAFRISAGRTKDHLPFLLEALAGLTPVVTARFERYLLGQAPRLEYGSVLIVITAITPPELLEALIRLRSRNRRTVLISLAEEAPPYVKGIEVIHAPKGEGVSFT